MKKKNSNFIYGFILTVLMISCQNNQKNTTTVPIVLDHNRMLVEAEIQKSDSTWHKVILWIDSGNPYMNISESLAIDLGLDLSAAKDTSFKESRLIVPTPKSLRINGMNLNTDSVYTMVLFQPFWLFSTMHCDGNLPSSILKKYNIVLDYPKKELTIADPNSLSPRGTKSNAYIHPETGIVCLDASIDGDSLCFALDMGASYSFISEEILLKYSNNHHEWPCVTGTLGCANMWGWWPANEQNFPVVRVPQIKWGNEKFNNMGLVGVTKFSPNGPTLGEWYSRKTAKPVAGFIGPNALKNYRVEIDYKSNSVYFEKYGETEKNEMDVVGISIKQLPDSSYQVVGIVKVDGKPAVEGIEPDDIVVSIDHWNVKGETMGSVVDKLRGTPGNIKKIVVSREGVEKLVEASVMHFL